MHRSTTPDPVRPTADTPGHDTPGHDPTRFDLVVVGAGVAGLAAALTATAAHARTLVVDAHGVGGRARTTDHEGWLLNVGPHALYRRAAFDTLLDHHGIVVTGGEPATGELRLVRDGVAHRQALTPLGIARTRLLTPRERVRLAAFFARLGRIDPASLAGRSVDDWLAPLPARVRQFVEMLVRVGTYTDAPELLDAGAAAAQLQLATGPGIRYVDGGWGSIVHSMTERVASAGGQVRTGTAVRSISTAPGGVVVTTVDGEQVEAGAVVVAAGGPEVAGRLASAPVRGADRLGAPVTASVLDLCLRRPVPRLAFGLDVPHYLSSHAPSAAVAPAGRGLVSVLRYHRPGEHPAEPAMQRAELRAVAELAGIDPADVVHERSLHRLVVAHGSPTAAGGGLAGRPTIDALGVPGAYVAGDWVGPVGLLADASAASGTAAARAALDVIARRATIGA
jgi:glycine/D-amino acid oxidase-like deaminating enzyme